MSEREIERFLKATEVSTMLGLHVIYVYELARSGQIPAVRIGRAIRFRESELLKWIDAKKINRVESKPKQA